MRYLLLSLMFLTACRPSHNDSQVVDSEWVDSSTSASLKIEKLDPILNTEEANRLIQLPMNCIHTPLPYKSGHVIDDSSDFQFPQEHHPAFYGCFDWHSAVHGHWSMVWLLKQYPDLDVANEAKAMLAANLTEPNIQKEIEYFQLNRYVRSFERTYGWAWLLKLQAELDSWEDPLGQEMAANLQPLSDTICAKYIDYLPKLVYPIRVGEHTNTAFGLTFAWDYADQSGDQALKDMIESRARDFYFNDEDCPRSWEPSGYDFLSPCLEEADLMRRVLTEEEYAEWLAEFLPDLGSSEAYEPAVVSDRSDGKLVHLDGLNFSRAWCLYSMSSDNQSFIPLAEEHLQFSLQNIVDGDYAGEHWLASFALYALSCRQAHE